MPLSSISEFVRKYGADEVRSISQVVEKWTKEKRIDEFLHALVLPGVMAADVWNDGSLLDVLPPEVSDGFRKLMKEKADTLSEIRQLLLDKELKGESSVIGLINKIQGQMGENAFVQAVGSAASLAKSGSQEGWDVVINRGDFNQYVQVKIFEDADGVMEKVRSVQAKLDAGAIEGVDSIDFAVNSDIFEEVQRKASEAGFPGKILDVGATREELRASLEHGRENLDGPLEHFFGELLAGVLSTAALHAAVNGFLWSKGSKDSRQAVEDTFYSTAVSTGGVVAAHATEALVIGELEAAIGMSFGPLGAMGAIVAGISARAVLKRIGLRRFMVSDLVAGNKWLAEKSSKLMAATPQ